MFYFKWPDFIVSSYLLCEVLSNMWIVCKPGCDIMNFEVNQLTLSF